MATIAAVIPHWPVNRTSDLRAAIAALQGGSRVPGEIVVWDNTAKLAAIEGVRVIKSPTNLGCWSRFLAARMTGASHVLFQDNDLALGRTAVEALATWGEKLPGVVALHGYSIDRGEGYKARRYVHRVREPVPVQIVTGRAELVPSSIVLAAMLEVSGDSAFPRMDDLWFSAVLRRLRCPAHVVPCDDGIENLASHRTGACSQPGHYEERARVYERLFLKEEGR